MDVELAIKKRKSIRRFENEEVSDILVEEVIKAAKQAPSSHNLQNWHFVVVKDKKTKEKFMEQNVFVQKEICDAPVIIVCCADKEAYSKHSIREHETNMQLVNLSLASAFLVLRATELELGTCFVAWCNKEKIKKLLGIPRSKVIPFVIVMGHPAENPEPRSRKSLGKILHKEKW
ncbi:MAG: nitroreductase family protein [Candidatus Nanoarchaeia archaeon]|nr:nitroreductase family protein [Candidatus Nanoarchaeia archaeon]MDD5239541.1 nitroreductase family protein [Candidatus Nanoarchaeia archaeon]